MRSSPTGSAILFVVFAALTSATPAASQCRQPCTSDRYPVGAVRTLSRQDVDSIRNMLRRDSTQWGCALSFYFREAYVSDLPDLVVVIDRERGVRQAFIQDGRLVHGNVLRGQKFLYVIVFSDRPPRRAGDATLDISLTSLDVQSDPFLARIVAALLKKLSFSIEDNTKSHAALEDSTHTEVFENLGPGAADTSSLYMVFHRLRIVENTWSRVRVAAGDNSEIPGTHHLVANFANADPTRLGASLALGWTANAHRLRNDSLVGQRDRFNLYILLHLYLARPELPRKPFSTGPFIGTSLLGGELLDELLVGWSFNRLVLPRLGSEITVAAGYNFQTTEDARRRSIRQRRFFVGIGLPI